MKIIVKEVIEEGQIVLNSELKEYHYILRVLDRKDIPALLQLQSNLIALIKQKDLYVPLVEKELLALLEGNGEALGFFIDNKMLAACSLLFRVDYENNMARELDFTDEELSRVAQLELSLVDPNLRGHKLQCKMAGILAKRVQKQSKIRYLFTTVSPYNYPSIETVTSLGLQIAKLGKMYYGWDRYVVYRDFWHPVPLDTDNAIVVLNTAFDRQQELLHQGYRGFSQFKDEDGIKIRYAKRI